MLGAAMSRLAQDQYVLLLAVAVLDLAVAIALPGSSDVFWRERLLSSQRT